MSYSTSDFSSRDNTPSPAGSQLDSTSATSSIHTANKRPDSTARTFVLNARFVSAPLVTLPSAPSRELNEDDLALQESWPAYGEPSPSATPTSATSSSASTTSTTTVSPVVVVSSPTSPSPIQTMMTNLQTQIDGLQQQLLALQQLPTTPEGLQDIAKLQKTRQSLIQIQMLPPSSPTALQAALAAVEPAHTPRQSTVISMHTSGPELSPTKTIAAPPSPTLPSLPTPVFITPQRKPFLDTPFTPTINSPCSASSESSAALSSSNPSPSSCLSPAASSLLPSISTPSPVSNSPNLVTRSSNNGDRSVNEDNSVSNGSTIENKNSDDEVEQDLEEVLLKHSHAGVSKTTLVVTKDSAQIKTMKTFLSGGLKMLTPQKIGREASDVYSPRSLNPASPLPPSAGSKKWKAGKGEITKIGVEFLNCGETNGVEMWKVIGFEMVAIDVRTKFYAQDSYLILQTLEHPHTGKLTHEVFLLHGPDSLPEHRMIAGIKLLELTRALRGAAKVFHETAGQESDNLFGCFVTHGIDYRGFAEGGSPSAMVHVTVPPDHIPVLLQVKGTKKGCIVRILAVDVPEFNTGDVFVLFSVDAVYVWMGLLSNFEERVRGIRLGMEIKGWKANTGPAWGHRVCSFYSLMEGQETPEFWDFFGGPQEILEADNCDEEFAEASLREPALSLYHLHELVTDDSLHGLDPPLDLAYNGFHEVLFMQWYHDNPWPIPRTPPLLGAVASQEEVTAAVRALQTSRREITHGNFSFSGTKDVACFKVLMDGLSLVPRSEHGVFSLAYHYVILHTFYNAHNKERNAIYFWQSPAASTMTLMKWKMQLKPALEISLKEVTKVTPISITLMQGEEAGTFLLLFPQGIIVLQPEGGIESKVEEAKPVMRTPGAKREPKEKHSQMFRISGCFYINGAKPRSEEPEDKPVPRKGRVIGDSGALAERVFARAIEISTDSAQLCSASAFILKQDYHPYCLYVWVGRFCSELEREAAEKMANKLLETSGSKVEEGGGAKKNEDRLTALYNAGKTRNKRIIFVEEDEEPEDFWSTFPGGNQKAVDLYKSKRAEAKKNPKFNKAISDFQCRLIMLSFKLELRKGEEDKDDTTAEVLQADEIKCANLADLEEGPVYILETFATLHIWNPAGRASAHLLLSAHLFAQKYAEELSEGKLRGKVVVAKQPNSGAHFFPYTTAISRKAAFIDPYDKNEEALILLGVQGRVVKPKPAVPPPTTPATSLSRTPKPTPASHSKRASRTGSVVGFGSTLFGGTPKQTERKIPLPSPSPAFASPVTPSLYPSSITSAVTATTTTTTPLPSPPLSSLFSPSPLPSSNSLFSSTAASSSISLVSSTSSSSSPRLSVEEDEEDVPALEFALRERAELVAQSAASVTEAKLAAMKRRETLTKQMSADRRRSLAQQNSVLMLVEAMETTDVIRRRSTVVDESGTPRRLRSISRVDTLARIASGIKPPTKVSSIIQKIEVEPTKAVLAKPQETKRTPASKLDQKKLEAWNKANEPPTRGRSASNSSTASGISTVSTSASRLRTPQASSSTSSSAVSVSPSKSFSFAPPLPPATPSLTKSSSFASNPAKAVPAPPKSPAPSASVNKPASPTFKAAVSPTNRSSTSKPSTPPTPDSPSSPKTKQTVITSATPAKTFLSKLTPITPSSTATTSTIPVPKPGLGKSASTSRLPQPKNVAVKPRFQL